VVTLKDAVVVAKTEAGKIKLHQTRDDPAFKGLVKGGVIGVVLAILFGGAGWIVAGAALGTAFSLFDRGIKDKLLKELGEEMATDESALAILLQEADWATLGRRYDEANYLGQIVISELEVEHLAEVQKLIEDPVLAQTVPEQIEVHQVAEQP